MALASDLLEQAFDLARKEARKPKQASLRRAISAAYYALFHLLVGEVVAKWGGANRARLARGCDHGRMKEAARKIRSEAFTGVDRRVAGNLRKVAAAFVLLQERRHLADYDYLKKWSRAEVLEDLAMIAEAFESWQAIRHEPVAEDFLLRCLVSRS